MEREAMAPGSMTTWSKDTGTFEKWLWTYPRGGVGIAGPARKILYKDGTLEIFRTWPQWDLLS